MKKILVGLIILLSGCINGSVEVSEICSVKKASTLPNNIDKPTNFTVSLERDYSEPASKLNKVGNLELNLNTAKIYSVENADLSFIQSLIFSAVLPSGREEILNQTDNLSGSEINLLLNQSSQDLKDALKAGPVIFKLTGTGMSPQGKVTPLLKVCASANVDIDTQASDAL